MNKKICAAIALSCLMAVSLAGCNKENETTASSAVETSASVTAETTAGKAIEFGDLITAECKVKKRDYARNAVWNDVGEIKLYINYNEKNFQLGDFADSEENIKAFVDSLVGLKTGEAFGLNVESGNGSSEYYFKIKEVTSEKADVDSYTVDRDDIFLVRKVTAPSDSEEWTPASDLVSKEWITTEEGQEDERLGKKAGEVFGVIDNNGVKTAHQIVKILKGQDIPEPEAGKYDASDLCNAYAFPQTVPVSAGSKPEIPECSLVNDDGDELQQDKDFKVAGYSSSFKFEAEAPDATDWSMEAPQEPGNYWRKLEGAGDYKGEYYQQVILFDEHDLSYWYVDTSSVADYVYTGKPLEIAVPNIVTENSDTVLNKDNGIKYAGFIKNNDETTAELDSRTDWNTGNPQDSGKWMIKLTGEGDYKGNIYFPIEIIDDKDINSLRDAGDEGFVTHYSAYNGKDVTPEAPEFFDSEKQLKADKDYKFAGFAKADGTSPDAVAAWESGKPRDIGEYWVKYEGTGKYRGTAYDKVVILQSESEAILRNWDPDAAVTDASSVNDGIYFGVLISVSEDGRNGVWEVGKAIQIPKSEIDNLSEADKEQVITRYLNEAGYEYDESVTVSSKYEQQFGTDVYILADDDDIPVWADSKYAEIPFADNANLTDTYKSAFEKLYSEYEKEDLSSQDTNLKRTFFWYALNKSGEVDFENGYAEVDSFGLPVNVSGGNVVAANLEWR